MNIEPLLNQGENQAIEYKQWGVRPESLAKEVVAFANASGGVVLVGVADSGEVLGLPEPSTFSDWCANILRHNVVPPIDCKTHLVSYKNSLIGVIEVPKRKDKPYQANQH